jgi:isocitrate/isopropylmalate dehydrogenase
LPLLLPAIDLLSAEGQKDAGLRILQAVEKVLTEGHVRTADSGGTSTTTEMTQAIVAALE